LRGDWFCLSGKNKREEPGDFLCSGENRTQIYLKIKNESTWPTKGEMERWYVRNAGIGLNVEEILRRKVPVGCACAQPTRHISENRLSGLIRRRQHYRYTPVHFPARLGSVGGNGL
jgi:hypothetical protein